MILLDTHALIWLDQDDRNLGPEARDAIETAGRKDGLAVSAISFWEVAMLARKGRVEIHMDLSHWRNDLIAAGLTEIPIDGAIGIAATLLDPFHADPADRLIVATAERTDSTLVTADRRLLERADQLGKIDARV